MLFFYKKSGLSRELFEQWCTDRRNGVIIAGYCVEGTLAKVILKLCFYTNFFFFTINCNFLKMLKLDYCMGMHIYCRYRFNSLCLYIDILLLLSLLFFVLKTLMSEPEEIATMTGQKIPRKCSIGKCCFIIQMYSTYVFVRAQTS